MNEDLTNVSATHFRPFSLRKDSHVCVAKGHRVAICSAVSMIAMGLKKRYQANVHRMLFNVVLWSVSIHGTHAQLLTPLWRCMSCTGGRATWHSLTHDQIYMTTGRMQRTAERRSIEHEFRSAVSGARRLVTCQLSTRIEQNSLSTTAGSLGHRDGGEVLSETRMCILCSITAVTSNRCK